MLPLLPPLALAALLSIACLSDLRAHRIPNLLCLFGLLAGVVLHGADGAPPDEIALSVILPFLIFLPFYIGGGMAAGDVKLMTASGALLGWPAALYGAGLALMAGTLLGCAVFVWRGGLGDLGARHGHLLQGGLRGFAARCGGAARTTLAIGIPALPRTAADSVAKSRFPYALAIAAGSFAALALVPNA